MTDTYGEKEIVWLPKELAKQVKEVIDDKQKEKLIAGFIEESKREIQSNLDELDESVIRYKGLMIKAKMAFEEAKSEQLSASYDLWDKFEKELPKVTEKVEKVKAQVEPLKKQMEEITKLMDGIRKYDVEKLLELVRELNSYLEYNGETAKILRFLFTNYKLEK